VHRRALSTSSSPSPATLERSADPRHVPDDLGQCPELYARDPLTASHRCVPQPSAGLLHRGLSTAEVIALELEAKDAASTELGRLQLEVGLHQFSRAETQVEAEAGSLPVVYRINP
jgi:hypothetical protein